MSPHAQLVVETLCTVHRATEQTLLLSVGLVLVVQSKREVAADVHRETSTVPDALSSRSPGVIIEGYLNYRVTHYEGKVIEQHI